MATPTSNSVASTSVSASGQPNEIAALIGGWKWGSGGFGVGVTVTYSFPGETGGAASYIAGYGGSEEEWVSWYALNSSERSAVTQALAHFAQSAGVSFSKLADNDSEVGELRFTGSFSQSSFAHAYYPGGYPEAGDAWFSEDWNPSRAAIEKGSYWWFTIIHELGHAMGLKHPFSGDAVLPDATDHYAYTVMAYDTKPGANGDTWASIYPTTYMYYDLLALEKLYGKSTTANLGNTTYTYSQGGEYWETINDAGGKDTIVYSATSGGRIELTSGKWSQLGQAIEFGDGTSTRDTVTIGPSAVIENATGGSGADTLIGNSVANVLKGAGGGDVLKGGGGGDTLVGGPGKDKLTGGPGADKFVFGAALNASTNKDTILDFQHLTDRIQLDDDVFTKFGQGGTRSLPAGNFRAGAPQDANDYVLYVKSSGLLSYDADGSGSGAAIAFALLGTTTHPTLTAADFQLIG